MTHEGPRGRRRSTLMGASVVLGVVAIALAITSRVTGEPKVLIAAIVAAVIAMLLAWQARRDPQPKPKDPRGTP